MSHVIKRTASGLAEFIVGTLLWIACMGGMCLLLLLVVNTVGYIFSGEWFSGAD